MDFHQTWYVHWYCGDLVRGCWWANFIINIFSFLNDNLRKFQGILTKLGAYIDIKEIWFGIANAQMSSIFDRVICGCHDNGGVLSFYIFVLISFASLKGNISCILIQAVLTYILHIIKMLLFLFLQILFYTIVTFSNDINKFCNITSFTLIAQCDSVLKEIYLCSKRKYFFLRNISYACISQLLKVASVI